MLLSGVILGTVFGSLLAMGFVMAFCIVIFFTMRRYLFIESIQYIRGLNWLLFLAWEGGTSLTLWSSHMSGYVDLRILAAYQNMSVYWN